MAKLKLTEAQRDMLRTLAAGDSFAPWGYRNAGRDASNWYRTVDVLVRHGLAIRSRGMAAITTGGRLVAALIDAEGR